VESAHLNCRESDEIYYFGYFKYLVKREVIEVTDLFTHK
jgi:hypothetical protein